MFDRNTMRFVLMKRFPYVAFSQVRLPPPRVHAVRYGADSCVDLALYEVTDGLEVSDTQRFDAAMVAWKMLENSSEPYVGPATRNIGMRSNPFAAARLFVRMLKRTGLEAEICKTPDNAEAPVIVKVQLDGVMREVTTALLVPNFAARVRRRARVA
jgi:hypothetical protein